MNLHREHWRMWAIDARDVGPLNIGYPTRTPFYTPAKMGDVYGSPLPEPTEAERKIVEFMRHAVNDLRNWSTLHAKVLVEHWGAYPGAPMEMMYRNQRMPAGLSRYKRDRAIAEAESFVQGVVWAA